METVRITSLCFFGATVLALVSCADLRDSEACYRTARLLCEHGCADDEEACTKQMQDQCHAVFKLAHPQAYPKRAEEMRKALDGCSDRVDALGVCATPAVLVATCADGLQYVGGLDELTKATAAAGGAAGTAAQAGTGAAGTVVAGTGVAGTTAGTGVAGTTAGTAAAGTGAAGCQGGETCQSQMGFNFCASGGFLATCSTIGAACGLSGGRCQTVPAVPQQYCIAVCTP